MTRLSPADLDAIRARVDAATLIDERGDLAAVIAYLDDRVGWLDREVRNGGTCREERAQAEHIRARIKGVLATRLKERAALTTAALTEVTRD